MGLIGTFNNGKDPMGVAVNAAEQIADSTFIEQDWKSLATAADHPHWQYLWGDFLGASIIAGVSIGLLIILVWGLLKIPYLKQLKKIPLKIPFVLVWIYGFIVYDIGMCPGGERVALITNAPMAILYAFKIFLLDSDVSEIQDKFHESWVYSLNFALCHFFAALISTLFVIKTFGFYALARIKIWIASLQGKSRIWKRKETYVFWGFNEASYRLIKSIQDPKNGQNPKDYRIIIVLKNRETDDSPEKQTGFARIFEFLSMPSLELAQLQVLGCLTTGTYANLGMLNPGEGNGNIIGGKLRLNSVKRLLKYGTTQNIHMIFLSDDENDNLHDAALLQTDSTFADFLKKNGSRSVTFYCHARFNSVHRVMEGINAADKVKVKIIDSSHINVEMLKEDRELLPVNFVDVERDGSVSSPFNALVVGFSEVGKDAVRFIYEYGAFVKSGGTKKVAERSPFHLDVVDRDMADLAGSFVANSPAIRPEMPFLPDCLGSNPDALITLHDMDCRSAEFSLMIRSRIRDLNYIVIATENDELNISLGVRLFKAAARYRSDLDNFCILVRIHNDSDGRMKNIADYYNNLWAEPDKSVQQIINIFGLDKEIYTFDNIISLSHDHKAEKYKERYEMSKPPQPKQKTNEEKREEKPRPYAEAMKQRRVWTQDLANCYHEPTKCILRDRALKQCGLDVSDFRNLERETGALEYRTKDNTPLNKDLERIAVVLAQTEHIRWNASHEILGYVFSEKKDEVKMHHDCLTDWKSLKDDNTRSFDNDVADFVLNVSLVNKKNNIDCLSGLGQ